MAIAITGNTFPLKDQLKALGGIWDADKKVWMVPDDKADHARVLVGGSVTASINYRGPKLKGNFGLCKKCGSYCYGDCT